jgi:hypothetical protein
MLLKYFTRNLDFDDLNATECSKDSQTYKNMLIKNGLTLTHVNYVNESKCVCTSLYLVSSVSPAFDKYLDGVLVNTDKFPAWTESSWIGKPIQMRLFMFSSDAVKVSSIIVGLAVFLISIVITFITHKYSDKWFNVNNLEQIAEIIEQ